MNQPAFLVIHTVGKPNATYKSIDSYHRDVLGWKGCGYHYVIEQNGEIKQGRALEAIGAHCRGLNDKSIGICCTGNGDIHDFTSLQYMFLLALCESLMKQFGIEIEQVIGHREAWGIPGVPNPHKTCPGKMVDMNKLRAKLLRYITIGAKGGRNEQDME